MSKRKDKKSSAKQSKKSIPPKQPPKPTEKPFGLVSYLEDRTTGIVQSCKLDPANVQVGGKCFAPVPLEWAEEHCEVYEAEVVEFGYSIGFLEGLPVGKDGKLMLEQDIDQERLASKKEIADIKGRKRESLEKANERVQLLPPLHPVNSVDHQIQVTQKEDDGEAGSDTGKGNEKTGNEGGETESATIDEQEKNNTTAQPGGEEFNFEPNIHVCALNCPQINTFTASFQCSALHCPLVQILQNASEEQIDFLNKINQAAVLHNDMDCDGCNQEHFKEGAVSSNKFPTLGDMSQLQRMVIPELPCLQPPQPDDETRTALNPGGDVYISKENKALIPWVTPRPEDAPKGQKKPPVGCSVYPAELVNYLLDLLMPSKILGTCSGKTLPLQIFNCIRIYVNQRLPAKNKLKDSVFVTFVTNKAAKTRRKLKRLNN